MTCARGEELGEEFLTLDFLRFRFWFGGGEGAKLEELKPFASKAAATEERYWLPARYKRVREIESRGGVEAGTLGLTIEPPLTALPLLPNPLVIEPDPSLFLNGNSGKGSRRQNLPVLRGSMMASSLCVSDLLNNLQ